MDSERGEVTAVPAAENDRDYIRSIERGFGVLLAFDEHLPNPTLAEIAAATGYSRPAVRRILLTLQRLGYVAADRGRWSLTPRVLTIGQHYSASHALIETAQPHLLAMAEKTGESASLATMDGVDVVYVARVPVRRIMSITVVVGTRVSSYATSMGRVLLAWAPEPQIAAVVEATGLQPFTEQTLTSEDEFRRALAQVRDEGFSIVDQELEIGLLSAAAPVRDRAGTVVAALASSTSSGRSDAERLRDEVVPVLLDAARAISAELGYRG